MLADVSRSKLFGVSSISKCYSKPNLPRPAIILDSPFKRLRPSVSVTSSTRQLVKEAELDAMQQNKIKLRSVNTTLHGAFGKGIWALVPLDTSFVLSISEFFEGDWRTSERDQDRMKVRPPLYS